MIPRWDLFSNVELGYLMPVTGSRRLLYFHRVGPTADYPSHGG